MEDKHRHELMVLRDVAKTVNLKLQVRQLTDSLKISRNEEAIMRARILELEQRIGVAVEKEEEMARKCIEVEASHEYEIAELLGEVGRVRDVMDELKGSQRELEERNEELNSQVHHYRNAVDEVKLEKDNMRKGFEEEKDKVENLELQVAGMKEKLEQAEANLGKMRNETGKLNKRNKELESNVDVLKKEKEALQNTLLEVRRECDDLKRIVRNKRSSPTEEETSPSLRKKGKFEQSHVQGVNVLESDLHVRSVKDDNCSQLNSNAPSVPNFVHCPDTEFNDFGKDKAEDCFVVNQIWAIYDSIDILPRTYALVVKKMASPFKLKITRLEPDPYDKGQIDWYDADLPIACGKFKLGSQKVTDCTMFSHQIQCMERSGEGSYLVYPKKGETWAIFKGWDIDWSSNPESHLTDEFEYVEILSDFTQNGGNIVAYLVKVEGFVSLFQRAKKNGINNFYVLPNELYRFSHLIPSYEMTGNEREGVPRGCFEFDTAALPTNFFDIGDSGDAENGPQSCKHHQRGCDDLNKDVRNKRSSPTEEEASLRKKEKFEQSHVQGVNVFQSDPDFRRSKEDNFSPLNSNAPSGVEIIGYPDTDFKDFDEDRGEDCFAANQFWAIYDNPGMPRLYALVKKVATPFKLKISWLKPDPDDQGEIDWRDADLPIACGKFKLGSTETVTDRDIFSHQIPCMKRTDRGSYMVYPQKGETWAIFRDWDIKWSSYHLLNELEYVEILSDFTENVGIQVAYLVKVEGFASLFQKTGKNGVNVSYVLPNELYCFSHRIPSYKLTGNEREGGPRGCFELDTAALPTDLFDVGDSGLCEDMYRMLHTLGK